METSTNNDTDEAKLAEVLSDLEKVLAIFKSLELNTTAEEDLKFEKQFSNKTPSNGDAFETKPEYVVFLCIAAVIFFFGLLANLAIIGRVLRQGVLRARIRMLLFSLSLADVVFILLEFPLNQFGWLTTVFWTTGDFMCRFSSFARGFAAYLITFILVVISLDRCLNTVKPMAPKAASKRTRDLLLTAVFVAVVCSLPQIFVFEVAVVPNHRNHKQCVSKGLIDKDDTLSAIVYPLFTFVCLYVVPLVVISMAYTIILYATTTSKTGQGDSQQLILFRQTSPSVTGSTSSTTTNRANSTTTPSSSNESYIRKAQMKTLRILLITVAVFFLCWLPYYANLLFFVCNRKLAQRVIPFWVHKVAELIAVSNACLNPFIFGDYLLKVKERFRCWRKK